MIVLGYEDIPDELYGAVVAIGNFDGVHIGHQEVIKTAVNIARTKGSKVGVITFDPHPNSLLGKVVNNKLLMSLSERANKLLQVGVDFVVIIKFTNEFALLEPMEFLKTVLIDALGAKHIITGYNFKFGIKGSGDTKFLARYTDELNYSFTQVNHIKYLGLEVSTTHIKSLIASGRVIKAFYLLGDKYKMSGTVIKGKEIAAKMFATPTANIDVDNQYALPLYGVYLIKARRSNGKILYGVANIGLRPTIEDVYEPKLEVHLFDFNDDLYDELISIELISFIRPERQFSGMEDLKYAIESDKVFGEYLLKNLSSIAKSL